MIETVSHHSGFHVDAAAADPATTFDVTCDADTSCIVVQMPDVFGRVNDLAAIAAKAHECGALLIVAITEAVSFGALKSPGAMGADIVVAEGQSIGNGLNFGGPYLGLWLAAGSLSAKCQAGVRRDRRRGWTPRLCADDVDARAAYPPRKSDEQHLHEFRTLRTRVLGASDASW